MDRSNREATDTGARPPLGMLVLAILAPFCVIGLLALPLAINTLSHLSVS
jgi:hypothetical protein